MHAFAARVDDKPPLLNENVVIQLGFDNGSVANITYVANGSKAMKKEYVEVFGGGKSAIIHDFKEVELFSGDTRYTKQKLATQDKGQKSMLSQWVAGLKSGTPCVSYELLMRNSIAVILAIESLSIGMPFEVSTSLLSQEVVGDSMAPPSTS